MRTVGTARGKVGWVTFPSGPVPVPDVVDTLAAGRPVTAVWENELGGVTFAIGAGDEYVKTYPAEHAPLLTDEATRLRWAGQYIAVPPVLGEGEGWLHTVGLPGRSAVDPRWSDDPETAARAIGAGLRAMHDALPVEDCPFGRPSWVVDVPDPDRLDITRQGAAPMQTFGGGVHYCLGAHLARVELVEALRVITARLTEVRVAGPVPWKPMTGISGPVALPIEFTARQPANPVFPSGA